ncbi:hypothetical protein HZC30_00035 [Candidatus Woesearchaeota archaeon]|nr:hypothetical protein [Candidatus Woesearchaeota archaeon]
MIKQWSQEQKILAKKIVIIAFLVMLVIGFTVPAFLDWGNGGQTPTTQQRNCQVDSDCYLMCEDIPVSVLCYQNLCWQNSCEEFALYPYNQTPVSFSLEVEINKAQVNLANLSNPMDFFVKLDGNKVSMYSQLALRQVLEKFKAKLEGGCLITNQSYCNGKDGNLSMNVNGEEAYSYGDYVPQEKDVIKIGYS